MPALRPALPLLAAAAAILGVGAGAQTRGPARARSAPEPPAAMSVTIQQQLIIRVPRMPAAPMERMSRAPASIMAAPAPPPLRWVEKKTGKCVPAIALAAATVAGADTVDLLLNGGKRLRARFGDDCPALDFYSGFYVKLNGDGKVCAGRDSIRSRSGGECRIASLRALVPGR